MAAPYVNSSSSLYRVAAHVKLSAALVFTTAVAVTPRRSLWVFGLAALLLAVGFGYSGLRLGQILKRFRILAPFLPVVVVLPFIAGGSQTVIAGMTVSSEGLWGSWNFLAKACSGLAVSIILTSTTSVADILAALNKLRAPGVLVAIAESMVRYIDVIVDETSRTRIAMASRGYDPRWLWQVKPLAYSAGALFVRSFERSERVHAAMLARGFNGTMPERQLSASVGQWVVVCAPSGAVALAAVAAILL